MIVLNSRKKFHKFLIDSMRICSSTWVTRPKSQSIVVKGLSLDSADIWEVSKLYLVSEMICIDCTIGGKIKSNRVTVPPLDRVKFIRCKFLNEEIKLSGRGKGSYLYFQDCYSISTLFITHAEPVIVLQGTNIRTVDCLFQNENVPLIKILMIDSSVDFFTITGRDSSFNTSITNESIKMIRSKVNHFSIKGAYRFTFYKMSPGSPTSEALFGGQVNNLSLSVRILESDIKAFNFSKIYVHEDSGIIFDSCDLSGADLSNISGVHNSSQGVLMQAINCKGVDEAELPEGSRIRDISTRTLVGDSFQLGNNKRTYEIFCP